ncbi:hypothetical protein B6N60_05291 [Richelia sinica FACHB-800]|uniref:Uncharacterized protein n=1 Tax=Richelia sinica FACHB-800 TaxID=1357546 RepID=A0A975TEA1_9NOST|nr:hypothetical protein B6N60_05291 [Richelia sinica FACHB-800]
MAKTSVARAFQLSFSEDYLKLYYRKFPVFEGIFTKVIFCGKFL